MKTHIGSTVAIIIGILYFISSLANPNSGLISGPIMILGAFAYRSAKKRKFGTTKSSTLRIALEIGAILVILIAVSLQKNIALLIMTDPVPNLVIPLWAIIAYSIIAIKKSRNNGLEFDNELKKVHFRCQNCGTKYSASTQQIGKEGECKKCGESLIVPDMGDFDLEEDPDVDNL